MRVVVLLRVSRLFQEVNGRLLLLVDEQGLDELSVTSSLHKKAFIEAVEHLKTKGVRLANNLWEFKVLV